MRIGDRIKQRRKELKMSADDLAMRLGKNRATIYRYEKGEIENLPLDMLEPIAEALRTTPQYLMGWDIEMKENPVGMAERHIEILMDEDFCDMFPEFQTLDRKKRRIVKDLVHSLAETEV